MRKIANQDMRNIAYQEKGARVVVKLTYTQDGFQFETKTVGQMVSLMRHIAPFLRELESAAAGEVVECHSCGNVDLDIVSANELYCERCGLIFQMPFQSGGGDA